MTRCACRPGCLTWLAPGDKVTSTPDGYALIAHQAPVAEPYPTEGLTSLTSALSKRGANGG